MQFSRATNDEREVMLLEVRSGVVGSGSSEGGERELKVERKGRRKRKREGERGWSALVRVGRARATGGNEERRSESWTD